MRIPRSALATLRGVRAPEGFLEGVMASLPSPARKGRGGGRIPRAALGLAAAAVFVGGLLLGLNLRPVRPALHDVSFVALAPGARAVAVAGSFNGWDPSRTPLSYEGEGRWSARVRLPAGRYPYMMVVDGTWRDDPFASDHRDDGFGRKNAVVSTGL